jgi:programmed cell death 6-interacting protein
MSNLLAIPFKKTQTIQIKDSARAYISEHGGAHPDEFKEDIKVWQDLRKDGIGGVIHVNRIDVTLLCVICLDISAHISQTTQVITLNSFPF